jgi:hypothetical protein
LPGVLLTDPTPDKTVPPVEAEFAFAHIALFLPKDCNLSVLDGPITGNHRRLQSTRYQMHGET